MSFNSNANNYNPMYGRQESAVSMESLGNAYTEDMKAMLETPLDLSDYLFDDMDGMRQNMVEVKSEPDEEEFGYEKDTTPLPSTSRQMIASPIIRHRKDVEEHKP
ncbi:hypothetical protein PRIPAC_78736 [Pristionchus pacificus]|nr:hypothetical protein PRIPAC_78736 [Pristionchus pacificus]|eukprot:PDM72450.1 hypothetical protein PRIPAC_38884 [Pristionchus pacificus]